MTFTISILIKSTIILLLTTALVLALKKSSASLRHLVISLGLFGLLLLPIFQYFTPPIEVEMPIVEQLELEKLPLIWEEEITSITPIGLVEKESPEFIQHDVYVPEIETNLPAIASKKSFSFFQMNMNFKEVLFWTWVVGCTLLLVRMLLQIFYTWHIKRKSQTIFIDIGHLNLQLNRKVHFLSNSTIKTPMTFGLFQPKILLPTDAQNWSKEQLKIVLLHELAHIKRHDYLLHLIGLLTLSLFWFHPLVWLLQKWQQSEREKACDEYVLKQGISKTNYAESLVQIARNMLSKKAHRWHSSLPMAASSQTKKRVLAILKFDLQQWRFTRWMQWRWIGFFACVLPLLAAIHPAAKELMEESIPKIEAVLEQPVFVPKAEVEEVEIIAKEELQNAHLDKDRIGVELIDTIARLPVPAIQQMNTQPYLPIIKSHQHKVQEEKILGHYGKWDNYNNRYVQVFTKGEFEVDKEYPYFKNLSEGALIVIQLSDKKKIGGMYNRKEQRLIIKKATYNAWVKKNHTASDAAIKQGELLFSWSAYSKRKSATVFSNQARELHFVSNQSKVDQEDWRLWMREDIKEVANMMRRFEDQEIWKEVSEEQPQKQWNMVVASSEFTFHQCLEPMSEEDRKIRDQQRPLLNKEALQEFLEKSKMNSLNTTEGKALYGKWEEENRIIEIWTRGDFDVQSGFPYFVNLSPKNLIIIRKRAKGKGKKCCEELFIQRLPFYGRLGKKDGIPISRGENIYTYKGENWRKIGYTLTSSSYGGFKFSDKKKTYRETLRDWKEMGIADLVQKMQTDANFLQPIKEGTWHWEQMTNTDAGVPGLGHILYTSEEEWQKIVQAYEVKQTLGKQKNKDQANLIQLPDRYVYIPSGQLKSVVKDGETEQTIQGFHMSETEITNRQYREFLRAMERRGKIEVLEKARIYNENWITKNGYNEPFAQTYHLHPAFNKYPVVTISHEGAQAYCQWMTELYNEANKNSAWAVEFRLPTKEEWMYAASAGHELVPYPWGGFYVKNAKGCYLGNFRHLDESRLVYDAKTETYSLADTGVPVKTLSMTSIEGKGLVIANGYFPNDYGLYNMSGNAAEMLQAKGSTKGGSWNSTGYHVRIDAEDEYAGWEEPNPYIGFRPIVVARKK